MIYKADHIKPFLEILTKGLPIIGIDYGSKRIGIAKTDFNWIISNPLTILETKDLSNLEKIIKETNCCGIILGYPLDMDGTEGKNCQKVLEYAKNLHKKFLLPIYLQDERFTTKIARTFLNESSLKRKEKDFLDNKVAASLILQSFLDFIKIG
jgi:putative Holliday junction resolvase